MQLDGFLARSRADPFGVADVSGDDTIVPVFLSTHVREGESIAALRRVLKLRSRLGPQRADGRPAERRGWQQTFRNAGRHVQRVADDDGAHECFTTWSEKVRARVPGCLYPHGALAGEFHALVVVGPGEDDAQRLCGRTRVDDLLSELRLLLRLSSRRRIGCCLCGRGAAGQTQ